jgi:hypothetical protein
MISPNENIGEIYSVGDFAIFPDESDLEDLQQFFVDR